MSFAISWPENTFLAEFSGVVTADEIEAVNNAFSGDGRMDTIRYSIWDFSRAASIEMPEQEIEYAAAFDKGVTAVRKTLRGALIANNPQVKERLNVYLAIAEDLGVDWDTRLFDTMESAEAWLEGRA